MHSLASWLYTHFFSISLSLFVFQIIHFIHLNSYHFWIECGTPTGIFIFSSQMRNKLNCELVFWKWFYFPTKCETLPFIVLQRTWRNCIFITAKYYCHTKCLTYLLLHTICTLFHTLTVYYLAIKMKLFPSFQHPVVLFCLHAFQNSSMSPSPNFSSVFRI